MLRHALLRCFSSPALPPLAAASSLPAPAAAAAAAHLLAPLAAAAAAPPALLDAPIRAAVRDFLAAPQPAQARALAALHQHATPAAPPAAALSRAAACSPQQALPFLAAVRRSCAAVEAGAAAAPWARAVDAAALATLRPLYGPALTPLQQLRLAPDPAAPWMPALLAAAQGSDSVRPAADARDFARKFGWRRLVHGLHHAAQPEELLAVLYTALLPGVPGSLAALEAQSGGQAPLAGAVLPPLPTTAAFYSVGSPASVARGLRLGTRIIYTLAGALAAAEGPPEARALTTFCTLSPVPGFMAWLRGAVAAAAERGGSSSSGEAAAQGRALEAALQGCREAGAAGAALQQRHPGGSASALAPRLLLHLQLPRWWEEEQGEGSAALRALAAAALEQYLLRTPLPPSGSGPACKVAAFHLGNGARLARLCGGGDPSPSGLARSAGFLVNYVYSEDGSRGLLETQGPRAASYAASPAAVLAAQRPAVAWSVAGQE